MNGHEGGDEDDPIDLDENDEEDENGDEGGGQQEPDEEEDAEEDDDDDDEDEFPDEGRRLSSVEAETYTDGEARPRPVPEDETMSDEESE